MGFQQGLSGLSAASKRLEAIGNNVSNASTVGFKGAAAVFSDVYANSLSGGGGVNIGIGTSVSTVAQNFSQGNISTTNNSLDIAINGNGFFRLSQNGSLSYSRNGQFTLDKEGYLINSTGQKVQGYTVSSGSIVPSTPVDLQISAADLKPMSTGDTTVDGTNDRVSLGVNIDSRLTAPTASFSQNNVASYNWSTSVTTYDSLGTSHNMTMYFRRTTAATGAASSYELYGSLDGGTATRLPTSTSTQTLNFDTSGQVISSSAVFETGTVLMPTPFFTLSSGASLPLGRLDFSGSTNYGSSVAVNKQIQKGYPPGHLASMGVSADGTVTGRYTNGQTQPLGQLVLVNFTNPNGLQSIGSNQWVETANSGAPLVGTPNSGTLGSLQAGAVEDSNIDLTSELVDMITAQRVYQANAQTIKTQDQVLQTLVNLR